MPTKIIITAKPIPVIEGGSGVIGANVNDCADGINTLISTWKRNRNTKQFNHSELAMLSTLAKIALDAMQEVQQEDKELRELLWSKCNPEDEGTRQVFDDMNKVKTNLKKLKKQIKTTESILLKLKKQTRSLDY